MAFIRPRDALTITYFTPRASSNIDGTPENIGLYMISRAQQTTAWDGQLETSHFSLDDASLGLEAHRTVSSREPRRYSASQMGLGWAVGKKPSIRMGKVPVFRTL